MIQPKPWDPQQMFRDYEAGRTYKAGLGARGLYDQSKVNERFYVGDQWYGARCGNERPLVRHNVIKRIGDYKMAMVTSTPVTVQYGAEGIPDTPLIQERVRQARRTLSGNVQADGGFSGQGSAAGASGATGVPGAAGVPGRAKRSGVAEGGEFLRAGDGSEMAGAAGASGATGVPGAAGVSGANGASGAAGVSGQARGFDGNAAGAGATAFSAGTAVNAPQKSLTPEEETSLVMAALTD